MKVNESPDVIKDKEDFDSPTYGDDDSITFALFNNFYLYSLWPQCTHGHLFEYLMDYIRFEMPDPEMIYQDKNGAKRLESKYMIRHVGELSQDEIDKIKSSGFYINPKNADRTPVLKKLPHVLQGRLWTDSKMISFWNDLVYIASRKKDIIEFINLLKGDPKQYKYEVKDALYNYEEFLSGSYNDNLEFDPKQIHTLSPDKKGDVLRKIGAQPKQPIPLQFKQMIQGESFKNWLKENL